jgi:hypothetical protein
MSTFDIIMMILSIIAGSISSAISAAIFSIVSAIVLQLLTRLIAGFKLSYFEAYSVSFFSWFTVFIFQLIGTLLSYKFEIKEIPGAVPHTPWHESIYPPGAIPYSTYITAILALLVISIIYGWKIEHPDTGSIGICKGFLIALTHAVLFILSVTAIVGYVAFIGP